MWRLALDTWHVACHVARGTCRHVNPCQNNMRWKNMSDGGVAQSPNFQVTCSLVWHVCHGVDGPEGVSCLGGHFCFFSALYPLAQTPLDLESLNLVHRCRR